MGVTGIGNHEVFKGVLLTIFVMPMQV